MRRLLSLALISLGMLSGPLMAQHPPVKTESGEFAWTYGNFKYDAAGNVIAIGSQDFIYDTRNRLVQSRVERPDLPSGGVVHQYNYDAYGNLTAKGPLGAAQAYPTNTATNHFTSQSAAYDAAGNLIQWKPDGAVQTYTYEFDGVNSLKKATANTTGAKTSIHIYTASDERHWTYTTWLDGATPREVSHWTIRDVSGRVLRDYQLDGSTWTVARDYFYRGNQLLAAATPSGNLYFSLDHLGTPRVTTNDSREVVAFNHYYPYGKEWTPAATGNPQPMNFTGHERDTDPAGTGYPLDYMHARYYNAEWGRFLAMDSAAYKPALPHSWNRYAYAIGNPIKFVDPDGLDWTLFIRDSSGGGKTNFGHVALRVHGNGYDYTYDYGRYEETDFLILGTGILNVWTDWGAFNHAQAPKGNATAVTWQTTKREDQAMIRHFQSLIDKGIRRDNSSSAYHASHARYELPEHYYTLITMSCVSITLQALHAVSEATGLKLEFLGVLYAVTPLALQQAIEQYSAPVLRMPERPGVISEPGAEMGYYRDGVPFH
ncbi:MAG TPA: RHS repeat-associated core domain-containing protein [Thermoanaerobaculia bacterium]